MTEFDPTSDDAHVVRVTTEVRGDDGTLHRFRLSGFQVADDLILTCAHNVVGSERIQVARASGETELPGTLAWPATGSEELDIALVRVPGLSAPAARRPAWGEYSGFVGPVDATGVGFPLAASDELGPNAMKVHGRFTPGEGRERHRLVFTVTSARPSDQSGWQGLSGMMLRDGAGYLLGVVAQLPDGWDGRQLFVIPARQILEQAGLESLVRNPVLHRLSSHHPLLKPAFERLGEETEFKLITARYGVVPFVNESHGSALDELDDWCTASGEDCDVRVKLLLGPGGSGKTRLAAELCERLRSSDQRWLAGFAREEETVPWTDHEPLHPTLVVFDYVERPAVASKVARFLKHLDGLGSALQSRVRVLLVSRNANDWRDHIDLQGGGVLSRRLRAEGDRAQMVLSEVEFTPHLRKLHFTEAFKRFTRGTGREGRDITAQLENLSEDEFRSPLLVHIAALLAAHGDDVPFAASRQLQSTLLTYLIRRERASRWAQEPTLTTTMAAPEVSNQALHAVAIMTLTLPTAREADEFLKASKLWEDQANAVRREAARAVLRLYPGTDEDGNPNDRAAPIEPDLISEHLLMEIDDLDDLLANLHHQQLSSRHYARLLHILSLACDHYPALGSRYFQTALREALKHVGANDSHESMQGGNATADLLGQSLPRLIETATKQAGERDPAIASILTDSLTKMIDNPQTQAMAASLEFTACQGTRELVELRCALLSLAVRHHRRIGDQEALLSGLERLVDSLLEVERGDEALEPLAELLKLREILGQEDTTQYRENLIQSDRLMQQLLTQKHYGDAYNLLILVMDLHRRLYDDDLLVYSKYLVVIDAMQSVLRRKGRRIEALHMTRESVLGRQKLGIDEIDPFRTSVQSLLALGTSFLADKKYAKAADTALEATSLLKSLGSRDPADYQEFLRIVDQALDNLIDDADDGYVAPLTTSIEFRAWLADVSSSYRSEYADLLERFADRLWRLKQPTQALSLFRRAVQIREALLDQNSSTHLELLAALYDLITALLQRKGDLHEVTELLTKAADGWGRLSGPDKDLLVEQTLLLELKAAIETELGRTEEASEAMKEAESIRRQLASQGGSEHRRLTSPYTSVLPGTDRLGSGFLNSQSRTRLDVVRTMRKSGNGSDFLLALLLERESQDRSGRNGVHKRIAFAEEALWIYREMPLDRREDYEYSHVLTRIALTECHAEAELRSWRVIRSARETLRDCKSLAKMNKISPGELIRSEAAYRRIVHARDTSGRITRALINFSLMLGICSPLGILIAWYYILAVDRSRGDTLNLAPTSAALGTMAAGLLYLAVTVTVSHYIGFRRYNAKPGDFLSPSIFNAVPVAIATIIYLASRSQYLADVPAFLWLLLIIGPITVIPLSVWCIERFVYG